MSAAWLHRGKIRLHTLGKADIIVQLSQVALKFRDEDPEFFSTDPDPAQLKKIPDPDPDPT